MALTNGSEDWLVASLLLFCCFALYQAIPRYLRPRQPNFVNKTSIPEFQSREARGKAIRARRPRRHLRFRSKAKKTIPNQALKSPSIFSTAAPSEESHVFNHANSERAMRLPKWIKEMLEKESRLDTTIPDDAEVVVPSHDSGSESYALCRLASKEREQGKAFKPIETYIQVIRMQLENHELRGSSASRLALSQICKILIEEFHDIGPPSFGVRGWWLSDTLDIQWTVASAVSKTAQWVLSPGVIDSLQTLADYIVKWYAPEALDSAAVLCERILAQLDSEFSFSRGEQSTRRGHVVRELAKILVEGGSAPDGSTKTISPTTHAIIEEGLPEVEKSCDLFERLQFYQNLGAFHVRNASKAPGCSGKKGEEILQRVYKTQKQLFGPADYRSVRTVDILTWYYVENRGRDLEAAQLLQDTLLAVHSPQLRQHTDNKNDNADETAEEEEEEEEDGDDDGEGRVEGAGDESRQRAIANHEEIIALTATRCTSSDSKFQSIRRHETLQARLMATTVPNRLCVWEDSRLYLSKNDMMVRFRPLVWSNGITDAIENYPVRITRLPYAVDGEVGVDVQVSIMAAHLFPTEDADMVVRSVRESHFCRSWLLQSNPAASPEHPTTRTGRWNDSTTQRDVSATENTIGNVFWAFPRDLMRSSEEEDAILGVSENGPTYQFQTLGLPGQTREWMVIVTEPPSTTSASESSLSTTSESTPRYHQHQDSPSTTAAPYGVVKRESTWEWGISLDDLACSITQENEDDDSCQISVLCPYIRYHDLREAVRGFGSRWGSAFTYGDFMQQFGLTHRGGVEDTQRILEIKKNTCRECSSGTVAGMMPELEDLPVVVFDQRQDGGDENGLIGDGLDEISSIDGFFNNIPASAALARYRYNQEDDDAKSEYRFNLVSSRWVDWRTFAVGSDESEGWVPEDAYPRLKTADGDLVKCLGFIRAGTWIPLSQHDDYGGLDGGKYIMDKVFVVDAVLTVINATGKEPQHLQRHDFIFCQESCFSEKNSRVLLTSAEKRCLMGSLNPSLYRYVEEDDKNWTTGAWMEKRKKKPPREPTFETRLMEEAERQGRVLREYEQQRKRYAQDGDDVMLKKIEAEHALELKAWAEFDERMRLVAEGMKGMAK